MLLNPRVGEFKQMIATLEAREAEHRKSGKSSSYLGWMLPGGGGASTAPLASGGSFDRRGDGGGGGGGGSRPPPFDAKRIRELGALFRKYDADGSGAIDKVRLIHLPRRRRRHSWRFHRSIYGTVVRCRPSPPLRRPLRCLP